mgnify:CR=1 FL=1
MCTFLRHHDKLTAQGGCKEAVCWRCKPAACWRCQGSACGGLGGGGAQRRTCRAAHAAFGFQQSACPTYLLCLTRCSVVKQIEKSMDEAPTEGDDTTTYKWVPGVVV